MQAAPGLDHLGFGVTTEFVSAPLQLSPGVFETVRDVDRYEGY